MIIGISGKAGCGKSTLARLLMERLPGAWQRIGFADILKREVAKFYGFDVALAFDEKGKGSPVKRPAQLHGDWWPWEHEFVTVRQLLQHYGTDVYRKRDPNYWVERMREHLATVIPLSYGVIIDDVRFINEAAMVRDMGGLLVRLEPYLEWKPGAGAEHASETNLDGWTDWDVKVNPMFGELDWVADMVHAQVLDAEEGKAA